jgi:3-deoxy-D-manno-octulosonic-acid transferase
MLRQLYSGLSYLAPAVLKPVLNYRLNKGKESKERMCERWGVATESRPQGELIWLHAASVGELISLLPLIKRIGTVLPDTHTLVTTGTITAAKVMQRHMGRLQNNLIHQFAPLDVKLWVNRFFKHWKPNLGVFVESELWPNLIFTAHQYNIPLMLINARMSEKSYQCWKKLSGFSKELIGSFEVCFAQSNKVAEQLRDLGAKNVSAVGNLKFAATPLPYSDIEYKHLENMLSNRKIWIAASTHPGEEEYIITAHKQLRIYDKDVLTILIPRHPHRGDEVAHLVNNSGLKVARRKDKINSDVDIFLINTIGEMGLFYALSPIAFIGGSLVPIGGHNPIEAALHNCALLWGEHTYNFTEICEILGETSINVTPDSLGEEVNKLLLEPNKAKQSAKIAFNIVQQQSNVVNQLITEMKKLINKYAV